MYIKELILILPYSLIFSLTFEGRKVAKKVHDFEALPSIMADVWTHFGFKANEGDQGIV